MNANLENPSRSEWVRNLRLWCLILGFALATSGVLYFFAYNWADLTKFQKFGLLELLLTGLFLGILSRGIDSKEGQVMLISASAVVGVLLAVIGQVYQSGADSYLLFLSWSVVILPWSLASRSNIHWALQFALVNTTVGLWWDQVIGDANFFFPTLLLLNLSLAFVWEFLRTRYQWMKEVITEALLLSGLFPIALTSGSFIIGAEKFTSHMPALLVACGLVWHFRKHSLFSRVVLAGCALCLGTALSIRLFLEGDFEIFGVLFIGISIMAQLALIVRWLKAFQEKRSEPKPETESETEIEAAPAKPSQTGLPWYVHALVGAGAWLASLFVFIFFLLFFAQSETLILVYGLGLYGVTLKLRNVEWGEFGQQACLVGHLSGLLTTIFGIVEISSYETVLPGLVAMALFLISSLKYSNGFGGFLFGLGFSFAGCWTSFLLTDPFLDFPHEEWGPMVWIGLSCALLSVMSWKQVALAERFPHTSWVPPLRGFIAGTLVLSTMPLVDRLEPLAVGTLYGLTLLSLLLLSWCSNHPPRAIVGLGLFSFLTQSVPTISVALLVYLIGFRARQKLVCGMALVALICSGSYFYYDLNMTLMTKSITLVSSGLSLLGLRMVLGRSSEEAENESL